MARFVHKRLNQAICCFALLGVLTSDSLLAGQEPLSRPGELVHLDLRDLMNIEITSVSRRPERLSDAAASVFVITGDDIRRSGATNLPEALRLAPSLDVVQVSAISYTVSARGFINTAANKLLVLIDGRSVYTPLFSGVFWDVQDVLLEDVDRIEVISGPGGTLWGVNAVNGVINIITRSAKDTAGGMVAAGVGNREVNGALRYGVGAGAFGDVRVFGKYFNRGHSETAAGTAKDDSSHQAMAGFRGDWEREKDQLMITATSYRGSEGQPLPGTLSISGVKLALGVIPVSGLNLTTRWKRSFDDGSSITVQGSFDRTERTVPPTFAETLNVADLQFLHSWRLSGAHTLGWGAEYRYGMDRVTNGPYLAFLPANVNQKWAAIFAQDEVTLRKGLRVTLGVRSERNDYTGNEILPNGRIAWNVAPGHLLWAAASRTVRAPSRLDHDLVVPGTPPFLLTGGSLVVSEIAKVYELGYRGQPAESATVSVTVFHALYDHLRTQEIAPTRTSLFFGNGMEGKTTGVETWASFQASSIWRLNAGFKALSERFELKPGSNDSSGLIGQRGRDAKQTWQLRSSFDFSRRGELDLTLRNVSERSSPTVPAYSAFDLRYGWTPRPGMELSVSGSNLFDKGHGEFTDVSTRTEIGRGVFINLVSRFGRSR
jgi:iron complex outermembrane receptor protein